MVRTIKSKESLQPRVVLSAFKGVTDQLISQANLAVQGEADISIIEARHGELLGELSSRVREQTERQVSKLLNEIRDRLAEVNSQRQLTPAMLDDVASYGEKLAINIASGYMAEDGIQGIPLSDLEAGIMTDSVFGNARILDESYALVREKVSQIHVPLVAGFFGADREGRITTLGRGASDYVATFIAAAFGCKAVLYKDVDGVMTGDPKVVPDAKLIPQLSYETAIELARYGSKILFEKSIVPMMNHKLPLEVTSFVKPNRGTLVTGNGDGEAVSYIKSMSLVSVSGTFSSGTAHAITSKLDESDLGSLVFTSQNEISIMVGEGQIDKVSKVVSSVGQALDVAVRSGVAVAALIGRKSSQAQVSAALSKEGVEPLRIMRAPSESVLVAVVTLPDLVKSVRALHSLLSA
jgi:aspartate kinase